MKILNIYRTCFYCGEQIYNEEECNLVTRECHNDLICVCNNCVAIRKQGYVGSCCFCGQPLKEHEDQNAEDYRLHKESVGKLACKECDKLIVQTNRYLSMYLRNGRNKGNLRSAINNLEEFMNNS